MATFEIDCLLTESLHKGRPKDEEPHVKRVPTKKENDSGIEYIVRVDLVSQTKYIRYDLDFKKYLFSYTSMTQSFQDCHNNLRKSWQYWKMSSRSYKRCLG